jgi:hypothetical protein
MIPMTEAVSYDHVIKTRHIASNPTLSMVDQE